MSHFATSKEELPLASTDEIAAVVSTFENCTLPHKHWTHRAHLCVAIIYMRNMPMAEALPTLRENINRYNRECGDPDGYNETITALFIRKLDADAAAGHCEDSPVDELVRLQQTYPVSWLYQYYSKALIWSERAKSEWVDPDIAPLDF